MMLNVITTVRCGLFSEDVLAVEKDGHKNVCLIKTSSLEMLTPDDEYVDTFLNESSVSDQISTGAAGT